MLRHLTAAFAALLALSAPLSAQDVLPTVEGDSGPTEVRPVVIFDTLGNPVAPAGQSSVEAATREGRACLSSTPTQAAATGDRLFTILRNPADSGRRVFLYNRIFGNNQAPADANIEYRAHVNPTADLANDLVSANAIIGSAPCAAVFEYEVGSEVDVTMGGVEATGEQLPNGTPYSRPVLVILEPGFSVGFSIRGAGNQNLSNAVTLSLILEWWEEPV